MTGGIGLLRPALEEAWGRLMLRWPRWLPRVCRAAQRRSEPIDTAWMAETLKDMYPPDFVNVLVCSDHPFLTHVECEWPDEEEELKSIALTRALKN